MPKKYNIPYVTVANGRVVYRPRITKKLAHLNLTQDSRGFLSPPIKLGVEGDSDDKIMQAYLVAKKTMLHQDKVNKSKLGYISDQYLNSEEFNQKAPKTQKDYALHARSILSHSIKINGKPSTLAELNIEELTKPLMNAIRESRLKAYKAEGKKGTVTVNRQTSYLQTAIKWGLNYIPELPQMENPLNGIKKFKEEANTRYVTDKEIELQCKVASEVCDYLPILIRLSYLLGTRGAETIALRHSDLLDEGIQVSRKKGSKANIIKWDGSLTEQVKKAKGLDRDRSFTPINPFLLTNTRGDHITQSALQSAMRRLKKRMDEKGLGDTYFTLHKTKSKAQSDSMDSDISGLTSAMKDRYTTKKKVVETGLKLLGTKPSK